MDINTMKKTLEEIRKTAKDPANKIERILEEAQRDCFTDFLCELCEHREHDAEALSTGPCSKDRCFKLANEYVDTLSSPSWTLCSEKLPAPETEVLVSFSDGSVKTLWQKWAVSEGGNYPGEPLAYVMDGYFPETLEDWEKYKVYAEAWMPLPEAYKKEAR